MRELQKLLLPQLLEDRHLRDESRARTEPSSPAETPSPRIPPRHPLRPSSGFSSSLPASPSLRTSSETFAHAMRPALEIVEEDSAVDCEMRDSHELESDVETASFSPSDCNSVSANQDVPAAYLSPMDWTLDDSDAIRYMEYNLRDENLRLHSLAKRQRADTLGSLASRMGSRMPSLSRKWKSRKATPTTSALPLSRASSVADSSRAPSFTSATVESLTTAASSAQLPPTPTRSVHNGASMDDLQAPPLQVKPSTPLLPPIMTELRSRSPSLHSSPQIQSLPSPPLSSKPSNASIHYRPAAPPLPASNANLTSATTASLVPSAEIPPMLIDSVEVDKWADALGHSNFHILPEPYVPASSTPETCQQMQSDWDAASSHFAQHLASVEHTAGPTSQIYRLTQDKWAEINADWSNNMQLARAQVPSSPLPSLSPKVIADSPQVSATLTPASPRVALDLLSGAATSQPTEGLTRKVTSPSLTAHHTPIHQLLQDPAALASAAVISPATSSPLPRPANSPPPLETVAKEPMMPALNAPGKFPCLGDEGIVGPMERAPTPTPPSDKYVAMSGGRRKRKFSVLIRDWLLGVRGH